MGLLQKIMKQLYHQSGLSLEGRPDGTGSDWYVKVQDTERGLYQLTIHMCGKTPDYEAQCDIIKVYLTDLTPISQLGQMIYNYLAGDTQGCIIPVCQGKKSDVISTLSGSIENVNGITYLTIVSSRGDIDRGIDTFTFSGLSDLADALIAASKVTR